MDRTYDNHNDTSGNTLTISSTILVEQLSSPHCLTGNTCRFIPSTLLSIRPSFEMKSMKVHYSTVTTKVKTHHIIMKCILLDVVPKILETQNFVELLGYVALSSSFYRTVDVKSNFINCFRLDLNKPVTYEYDNTLIV